MPVGAGSVKPLALAIHVQVDALAGLASANAPPLHLPGEHFVAALTFLALGGVGLVWIAPELAAGAFLAPRVAGVAHLFTLGFVTMSILGALYQFLPVAVGTPIRSQRAAHVSFALMTAGVPADVNHAGKAGDERERERRHRGRARAGSIRDEPDGDAGARRESPPEPMVRTLEALARLPPGKVLVQINARVPRFLLPKLAERGFAYEVREFSGDVVRIFIRHANHPAGERTP